MPAYGQTPTPWDVLMVSAGSGSLTRFALRPTSSWTGTTLSTLMPMRQEDRWWWLKAEMTTQTDGDVSLDAVCEAINEHGLRFDVAQARGAEPFEPLAELTFTPVVPTDEHDDVSFDPTRNTAVGVELGPRWLTDVRERAYSHSRHGRDAPDDFSVDR